MSFSYHSCPGVVLTYNSSRMNHLLTFMEEKKYGLPSSSYCGLEKCKRSVFCFPIPMHWVSLFSSLFFYLSAPHPHPHPIRTPTLTSTPTPTPSPAQHSSTSKIKHTSILFQEFQRFSALSRDLQDGSEPWIEAITDCIVNHRASLARRGCLRLSSALHIGTARLAFPQAGLTLAAEDGEGTQAGFQFFHEPGAVCSQYAVKH